MEGPPHLLSLKVMRVSRPELASAWQPFYSNSLSFSAHSTASIVSLQGNGPLPVHPTSLRDLTHASELLILPPSFGFIQLGETFSSCLCINNEAQVDVDAVSITVEMQTATAKVVLAEFGGADHKLAARDTIESIVHHEIKELGQHVLACAVTYRVPQNIRQPVGPGEHPNDPSLQTFRKFYKFAVTNPLSVKTKVHTPRSPSALVSATERDKVFLEVHIQNLTQDPMHFERMLFECAEGWDAENANVIDLDNKDSIQRFLGPQALMQSQDIRQYIYILTPKSASFPPMSYTPGAVIPLGRLDILWRSSFGEPGRLLTSMLSRRIPIPAAPAQSPVSALPSYLRRNMSTTTPSRPQSAQLNMPRPGTPPAPQRPDSPSPGRPSSVGVPRSQSPFQAQADVADVEVNLIIRETPRTVRVERPFTIPVALVLSYPSPTIRQRLRRAVKLVVQHLQPPRSAVPPVSPAEACSPRLLSSGFSTPSSFAPTFNYALAHQKLAAAAVGHRALGDLERNAARQDGSIASLPPPYFSGPEDLRSRSTNVIHVGSSATYLPTIELTASDLNADQLIAVHDIELTYVVLQKGFATVGGLRVLLVEDRFLNEGDTADNTYRVGRWSLPRILKEWDVVSEVWVLP